MLGDRNRIGLTPEQIRRCEQAWAVLCGEVDRALDVGEASQYGSRTRFVEEHNLVSLGADAYPGVGSGANSRLSMLACLAHELAHVERFEMGYRRPLEHSDRLLDEAETSLHASFSPVLSARDREDLIEDARDRLIDWLAAQKER